jgi:serine/threonine protein kinase
LLDALRRCHLLGKAQLDAVARRLDDGRADPQEVTSELLRRGWLTAYQVNLLVAGRADELLLGSFVVLDRIGAGGMGAVFKARHRKSGQVVAVKVIRKERLDSPAAMRRFQREIRAVAQLNHPNIVRFFHAEDVGGTCFMTMEYVEGTDLANLVRRRGPLPVAEACEYVRQAALGLQHAFEHGLVHRDIKPSNLLLEQSGVVKVLDFGLARLMSAASGEESSSSLTETGAVMGTPDYMAPEQAMRSHDVDIRADLYSLGATLYFLLTGQPPFFSDVVTEILLKHQLEVPRPVTELRQEVPAGIAAVVHKLLEKRPEDRYQTPAELAEALARGGEPAGHRARPRAPSDTSDLWSKVADPDHTEEDSPSARLRRRRRRRAARLRIGVQVGAAAGLLLAGLALLNWFLSRRELSPQLQAVPPAVLVTKEFQVKADQLWQDTGVDIAEGGVLELLPQGKWFKGKESCTAAGFKGASLEWAVLAQGPATLLCLLARVGDEDMPWPVQFAGFYKAGRGGRLYVQANDLDLADNGGSLQLTIKGGYSGGNAAEPAWLKSFRAAHARLPRLLADLKAGGLTPEQERDLVFDFCSKHAGTPHAFCAGQLVAKKPPLVNSIGMELVPIPSGKYLMGSPAGEPGRNANEGPQREVFLTRPFYLGKYEVTRGQYAKVTGKYPSAAPSRARGAVPGKGPGDTNDWPVDEVTWDQAAEFCRKLSELPQEKRAGRRYRLPTEAEWEYACRARTNTPFHFGAGLNGEAANCNGAAPYGMKPGPALKGTCRVGA